MQSLARLTLNDGELDALVSVVCSLRELNLPGWSSQLILGLAGETVTKQM